MNRLVDLDESLYGGDVIEGDLDALIFNPIVSTILKWLRFKFSMWMQCLHHSFLLCIVQWRGMPECGLLYSVLSSMNKGKATNACFCLTDLFSGLPPSVL
jgi:hypothetical protein